MSEQLKPCPFCGGTDLKIIGAEDFYLVQCNKCLTDGPWCWTPETAADMWNTRPGDAERALMQQPDPPDISQQEADRLKQSLAIVEEVAAKNRVEL